MGTIFSNTISPGLGHGLEEFQMELETQSGRSGPAGIGPSVRSAQQGVSPSAAMGIRSFYLQGGVGYPAHLLRRTAAEFHVLCISS